ATLPGQAPARPADRPRRPLPKAVTYAPTFYPGASTAEGAARLTIQAGDERTGVDFALAPVPVASISGTIVDGNGQVIPSATLSLVIDGPRLDTITAGSNPRLSQPPGADGKFIYTNMPPGKYTIVARGKPGAPPPPASSGTSSGGGVGFAPPPAGSIGGNGADVLFASAEVVVNGQDVEGLRLTLLPGTTVSGRVVFPAGATPPDVTKINVQVSVPGG